METLTGLGIRTPPQRSRHETGLRTLRRSNWHLPADASHLPQWPGTKGMQFQARWLAVASCTTQAAGTRALVHFCLFICSRLNSVGEREPTDSFAGGQRHRGEGGEPGSWAHETRPPGLASRPNRTRRAHVVNVSMCALYKAKLFRPDLSVCAFGGAVRGIYFFVRYFEFYVRYF